LTVFVSGVAVFWWRLAPMWFLGLYLGGLQDMLWFVLRGGWPIWSVFWWTPWYTVFGIYWRAEHHLIAFSLILLAITAIDTYITRR